MQNCTNNFTNSIVSKTNYWNGTRAQFKVCRVPKREADFVSESSRGSISKYWYGANKTGEYVIRQSDHWCRYIGANGKVLLRQLNAIGGSACNWDLVYPNEQERRLQYASQNLYAGKCYFADMKVRVPSPEQAEKELWYAYKAYLNEAENIHETGYEYVSDRARGAYDRALLVLSKNEIEDVILRVSTYMWNNFF